MALALPRIIQLKLEQTLAQWSRWHCVPALTRIPDVVRVLTHGISNFSVLVEAGVNAQVGLLSFFAGVNWQDGGALQNFLGGQIGIRYSW